MNKYPEKVKLAVINRYLNGAPISKISHDTKISRTTVFARIKQHNTTFNKGKAPNFRYLHDLQQKCNRQQKIIEILKRSPYSPISPLSERYEAIKALSTEYNVNILCEALNVAKGSYYNHLFRIKTEKHNPLRSDPKCCRSLNKSFTNIMKFSKAEKFMRF